MNAEEDVTCDHFGLDTLQERRNEVATESLKAQIEARVEHGDDEEFREYLETLLDNTD